MRGCICLFANNIPCCKTARPVGVALPSQHGWRLARPRPAATPLPSCARGLQPLLLSLHCRLLDPRSPPQTPLPPPASTPHPIPTPPRTAPAAPGRHLPRTRTCASTYLYLHVVPRPTADRHRHRGGAGSAAHHHWPHDVQVRRGGARYMHTHALERHTCACTCACTHARMHARMHKHAHSTHLHDATYTSY